MRLLSVNVGLPRTISWRGKDVRTAIWKEPVAERRWVSRLNVDGDAQADLVGHGGEHRAVFVYQLESYRYWERELGRPLPDLGQFGENFTVVGMPDEEVCIGDRYAIGSALFEVTQPRVTCYKVGIRLDEPRMPALLTGHGRPGFYLRVLKEGEVGADDEIVRVGQGVHRLSVHRVSAMLYTPDFDGRSLRRALENPALSEGWKWSFRQLLEQHDRGALGNSGLSPLSNEPPAYAGFRHFRIVRTLPEATGVRSLVLEPANGEGVPPHRPGQFVTVRLADGQGAIFTRSYSISSHGDEKHLRISVKREGRASAIVHQVLEVGDLLEVGAPRGSFVLEPEGADPVALISAGIGVTPVLAMLTSLAEQRSRRPVTWVHVARNGARHSFAVEARRLLAALPQARSLVLYTQPEPKDRRGEHFDADGRLTGQHLRTLELSPHTQAYVCGPPGFMADVTAMLTALEVDAENIHTETFGSVSGTTAVRPPHEPSPPSVRGPEVSFARSGIAARFDDERWRSLLELAEGCDVPVSWSCRTGVCHRCETAVIVGEIDYDPEPLDLPAPGTTLLCSARPAGDVTLDL
ncbi:MAG TPA: MOSC and FAD-binding oxidoreductase domain-containing protein [Jiangellaceae bacterium]|nr:MOSC and FAD-binding oxidoreductase domain-containing protein [Jiangellaceae bacterium]